MPRKGVVLSPDAADRQAAAIAAWHAEHYYNLSISVRKGKRDAYKALAAKRGTSVSRLVQDYLDAECAAEGIEIIPHTGKEKSTMYEELLTAAVAFDAPFSARKALADWLVAHNTGWNGESWDISDPDSPSGSRSMRPVYGPEDEDGCFEIVDYEIF